MGKINYSSKNTILIKNKNRSIEGVLIGGDEPTKLGVLLGITPKMTNVYKEFEKAQLAITYGVSTFTDLTTDGSNTLRKKLIDETPIVVGTVPIYEFYADFRIKKFSKESVHSELLNVIRKQAQEGVDFFSIQASISKTILLSLKNANRIIPITSRGGAILVELMNTYNIENPILTLFDDILAICHEYHITLSFVGSLRPGCISDAFEELHIEELKLQRLLADRAIEKGVSVIIELVNHVEYGLLEDYCQISHEIFDGLPYGALGPTTTDIGVGYDDVVGAIGAAKVVSLGISWINLVTAGEHTYFPKIQDLESALKYYQLAFQIGNTSRFGNKSRDEKIARERSNNNWEGIVQNSIFPEETDSLVTQLGYKKGGACTLCDKECPLVRMKSLNKKFENTILNEKCKLVRR